jgi:Kef-type K+ transport system membrane component KefB
LPFFLALAILIAVAKASGYLAIRFKQPAVFGELLVGVILGPTVLNMLGWPAFSGFHLEETFGYLANLGVLFLMFIAGLEVDIEAMVESGRASVLSGAFGALAPLILAPPAMALFGYDLRHGIFIGLILAATSTSISAQTLMELGVLRTRVGTVLMGSAVVDDILVILFLSLFTALTMGGGGGTVAVLLVLARIVLFMVVALFVGMRIIPKLVIWVERLPISQSLLSLVVVMVLLYSWAAEALGGMASITGAFVAGLAFARTGHHRRIESAMSTLSYSWLVPVFFVSIGLDTNARILGLSGIPFALVLVLLAILTKIAGCGLGARLGGCTLSEARAVGVGMVSRGEVGLIIATVGLSTGLIGQGVYAASVIVVLVTTVITPVMLRALYPRTPTTVTQPVSGS